MAISLPTQTEFAYKVDGSIKLPELSVKRRVGCGNISQRLLAPTELIIERSDSAARQSQRLILKGGMSITASRRKSKDSSGSDGFLFLGNPSRWLKHKLEDEFTSKWNRDRSTLHSEARSSWKGQFAFQQQRERSKDELAVSGLRPPQIGALHAVGAHWSISTDPATIVMPTGTGKTETMLGVLVAYRPTCLLVVVPTDALRPQTAEKFRTLGILRETGNVLPNAKNPVVGILEARPKTEADLEIFERSNVVVATAAGVAQGTASPLLPAIAERCTHLIFDEAHHVPAASWSSLKAAFHGKPILQFTATPYREDGNPIEGKVIYNYPLKTALAEGFFKRVHFRSVFHADEEDADRAIAKAAIEQLENDTKKNFEHCIMARCRSTKRAEAIAQLYQELAPELKPGTDPQWPSAG